MRNNRKFWETMWEIYWLDRDRMDLQADIGDSFDVVTGKDSKLIAEAEDMDRKLRDLSQKAKDLHAGGSTRTVIFDLHESWVQIEESKPTRGPGGFVAFWKSLPGDGRPEAEVRILGDACIVPLNDAAAAGHSRDDLGVIKSFRIDTPWLDKVERWAKKNGIELVNVHEGRVWL